MNIINPPRVTITHRRCEAVPPGWRVVGKLLFMQLPFVKKGGESSGFAETSDEFEF